jgi:transcriptional regulatory protein LevR
LLIFAQRTEAPASRVEELDQTQAMKRLLRMCPWTCLDLPMAQQFLDVLARLSRQCRAFVLYSGTDLLGDRQYTTRFLSSIIKQQAA